MWILVELYVSCVENRSDKMTFQEVFADLRPHAEYLVAGKIKLTTSLSVGIKVIFFC